MLSTTIYDGRDVTPGILRPEEQHNTFGRCRHPGNRHNQTVDTACIDKLGPQADLRDEQDLQSAATMVASPTSQAPFDNLKSHSAPNRHSTSSDSSYSSRDSDVEGNLVSTNQLIRYYTGYSDQDDDILTRPFSRFSTADNPWQLEEATVQVCHPLQAHPTPEKSRQGSAPPPYQPGSRKSSHALPEHYQPRAKACLKSRGIRRRSRLASDVLEKNIYLLKLCKAFLLFGIQAHRLEEYLHITADFLEIAAESQYVPHCMFVVLTNPFFEQNEIHLLKESTSVDLGKLEDIYHVYESVVGQEANLQTAIRNLDSIIRRRRTYRNFLLILLHGVAALCAGTFAFSARPVDFPPLFLFGCLLAILQLIVLRTPIRNSHILEVLTSIIVAFTARALGSIYNANGEPYLCFSGIVQGTIALILPGHIILAATHEIQNRAVLSGSVKMIYAIVYTLFLGFGILIGSALFGFINPSAVNTTTCTMPWYWNTLGAGNRWRATYSQFVWVPMFALAISIMHQAKRKHLPAMVIVATCGHQAFYWSLNRFAQNLQFAGMIGAFASGLLANLYAWWTQCLAATTLLPAVLVQIPNALAASGSLVAGVDTADAIVTNSTYWIDATIMEQRGLVEHGRLGVRDFSAKGPSGSTGLIVTAGFGMAQATIGITVGLFLSAFVVYPFAGRRRRGAGWLGF